MKNSACVELSVYFCTHSLDSYSQIYQINTFNPENNFPVYLFFIIALSSVSAQVSIPQPTHEIALISYDSLLPPDNSSEIFNYYDSNGRLYQTKTNNWDGISWVLRSRTYYTLNVEGKPTFILSKRWDAITESLSDDTRTTIEYHANGLENYRKDENWKATTGVWETEDSKTTTFTASNKVLEDTDLYYKDDTISSGSHSTYTYDGNDRISIQISQSYTNGSLYLNSGW